MEDQIRKDKEICMEYLDQRIIEILDKCGREKELLQEIKEEIVAFDFSESLEQIRALEC